MVNMKNRKGQGGDTFKLLIAAVVAMVILGIVTGVFQNIWDMVGGITCVSSPINELVTKIQSAQSGIDTPTGAICMDAGAALKPEALRNKVNNLGSVTFQCLDSAAVCSGTNPPLTFPTTDTIAASSSVKFKAVISCTLTGASGNYDCTISVRNA